MGQLTGFRTALGFLYYGIIIATALVWACLGGTMTAFMHMGFGTGFVPGLIAGGAVGWLFGAFVNGIGYTLLSINDHLAALRKGLEEEDPAPDKAARVHA